MSSIVWESFSPEETFAIGEKLGREANPGEVYTLIPPASAGPEALSRSR